MVAYAFKIIATTCLTLAVVLAYPADDKDKVDKKDLKYTFGSNEEIPAAFFESTPLETKTNNSSSLEREERQVYPACQDGSGGLCVNSGTCPSNLKPETNVPGACASGQECCFGPPSTDRRCRSRGGECVPTKQCGKAPTFLDAVDCSLKDGNICCILV